MRAARNQFRIVEGALVTHRGDPQLGTVPRHLRVPPRQPAEARAVGVEARRRVEVVAGGDHLARIRLAIDANGDERRDRLVPVARMILADAEEPLPPLVDHAIGVEPLAFRRDGIGRSRSDDAIDALVGEVRVVDEGLRDEVRAAAVFVDARADVVIARRDVDGRAVGASPDEHVASAFLRTPLEPVDVVPVERRKPESESLRGDGFS